MKYNGELRKALALIRSKGYEISQKAIQVKLGRKHVARIHAVLAEARRCVITASNKGISIHSLEGYRAKTEHLKGNRYATGQAKKVAA